MAENRRYGKGPRLCGNDGESWSTRSDISDDDPSIPPHGSRIPEHAAASQEHNTAACTSADSSPFICELCKVDLVTFDLFCEHLSVHKEEEPTGQERTVVLEPIPVRQQCRGEGTEPTDAPHGRIGSSFPASSTGRADGGAIPSTIRAETQEKIQPSSRAGDSYNVFEDEETREFFHTVLAPSMYVDASMTYNETIGFQYSILNTIADEALPSTSPQTVNNIEDSHTIYEDERTMQLFPTYLSPSKYESSLCLEPSFASTSRSVDGGAETSRVGTDLAEPPDRVSGMETIPDVPRLPNGDVRPNKAARFSGNTLGKEEGQHQGSVHADVDSIQEASGRRPYTCEICKKSFARTTHLHEHHRTHTNERPYLCEICGRSFKTNSVRTKHRHTHTNDKPYRCELCGASFKRKYNLKNHGRTHTNDRPYVCEICGRSFRYKSNLTKHRRTHTKHTPYSCELCGTSFTTKINLKRHCRTHTDSHTRKALQL